MTFKPLNLIFWIVIAAALVVAFNVWPQLQNSAWFFGSFLVVVLAYAVGTMWLSRRRAEPPPP
jgi:ABC-type Fe3+ transport system permease subunit